MGSHGTGLSLLLVNICLRMTALTRHASGNFPLAVHEYDDPREDCYV